LAGKITSPISGSVSGYQLSASRQQERTCDGSLSLGSPAPESLVGMREAREAAEKEETKRKIAEAKEKEEAQRRDEEAKRRAADLKKLTDQRAAQAAREAEEKRVKEAAAREAVRQMALGPVEKLG